MKIPFLILVQGQIEVRGLYGLGVLGFRVFIKGSSLFATLFTACGLLLRAFGHINYTVTTVDTPRRTVVCRAL